MHYCTLLFIFAHSVTSQTEPQCKPFRDIYATGKELCENIWSNDDKKSFTYIENDDSRAYTMWFFDDTNPNDQVTTNRGLNVTNECLLSYYHREATAEADNFTECHPWKNAACCYESTVKDVETLINKYGDEYRWNRCGALSQSCERFFVQEACFYECDPNVGLYLYQGNHSWKIHDMPIKASYCDAWWRACANDYFCASDSGSFFSCAKEYKVLDASNTNENTADIVLIIIIIFIGLIVIGLFVFICHVRSREKKGDPYFVSMSLGEAIKESVPADSGGDKPNGDAEMIGTR